MAEKRVRLRVGVFVAGTLLTLAGLVVLFGSAPTLLSTKSKYVVLFPEAPGIARGTPIRKSGVRIGAVTKLDLDPASGQVRVEIAVDPKYPPRTTDEPTITRGLLNGDSAIDFLPKLGSDGQPLGAGDNYPAGEEIAGVPPITPRSLLTPASGAIANAQQALERVVTSIERVEKVAPKLERALDEIALLAGDVRKFVPELKKTNDRIQNFIGGDPNALPPGAVAAAQDDANPDNLKTVIRDIRALLAVVRPAVEELRGVVGKTGPEVAATVKSARATFDAINDVLSPENRKQFNELTKNLTTIVFNILKLSGGFQTLLDEAEKTVRNFDRRTELTADVLADIRKLTKPLGERSEGLVREVTDSATQLNKVLTEVREIVRVFGRGEGTAQKLLSDPALYNNLDAASVALARVLIRADKIAKDLEVFADKVARRPELIGVGGAVRPSSGLKDSPFAPTPGVPSYRPDWPPALPARPVADPADILQPPVAPPRP